MVSAQDNTYSELRRSLAVHESGVSAESRLLGVVVLDLTDAGSARAAQQLSKAVQTFKVAKLSGGRNGIVGMCVVRGPMGDLANDARFRDLQIVSLPGFSGNFRGNAFYDSAGRLIYKDLSAEEIFSSIQKLITR